MTFFNCQFINLCDILPNGNIFFLFTHLQKKKKVKTAIEPLPDVDTENLSWSNADIEFPSTSNSDEIEVHNNSEQMSIINATTSATPTIAAQLSDLAIDDKSSIVDQLNENESLSKFVFDYEDDASICKSRIYDSFKQTIYL